MGQATSTTMTSSPQEERMKKRIRMSMGSFTDLRAHLKEANAWARLCPTPKTCYLDFRIVINDRINADVLPYVWRIRGNVSIQVRKLRRQLDLIEDVSESTQEETIGQPKILTVRQFYYIYCFLYDIKSCTVHNVTPSEIDKDEECDFDEMECQICMDKQKQVVLPCTHSFCLGCFQHWSAQNKTCPICRAKLKCSEGEELWHLTSNEVEDIGAYATDLVARIYEFLEKREKSDVSEEDLNRSAETFASVCELNLPPFSKMILLASQFGNSTRAPDLSPVDPIANPDLALAMELASGEDQYAAMKRFDQLRKDHVFALTLAMQVEEEEEDPNEF